MIDKIKLYFERRREDKWLAKNLDKYISLYPTLIDSSKKGIIIFQYGTPDYIVSERVATRIQEYILSAFKEQFPTYTVLFMPFYISPANIIMDGKQEEKEE